MGETKRMSAEPFHSRAGGRALRACNVRRWVRRWSFRRARL